VTLGACVGVGLGSADGCTEKEGNEVGVFDGVLLGSLLRLSELGALDADLNLGFMVTVGIVVAPSDGDSDGLVV